MRLIQLTQPIFHSMHILLFSFARDLAVLLELCFTASANAYPTPAQRLVSTYRVRIRTLLTRRMICILLKPSGPLERTSV